MEQEKYEEAKRISKEIDRMKKACDTEQASVFYCEFINREGVHYKFVPLEEKDIVAGMRAYYQAKIAELEKQFEAL